MGIKFDILSQLLLEDSELSKFFTSSEPIQYIHKILNLKADSPVNIYSANRHEVWDHLRDGDAVLVIVHKGEEIQKAKESLNQLLSISPVDTGEGSRARDLNEIKTAIRTALRYTDKSLNPRKPKKTEQTTELLDTVKKVKRLFLKKGASGNTIMDKITGVYGEEQGEQIKNTIQSFIKGISEADRILIKRVSHTGPEYATSTKTGITVHATEDPQARKFPVAHGQEKIQWQNYHIWYFSQDKFLKHEWKRMNVTHVTRPKKGGIEEISGYGHKSFYTIPNVSFSPIKTPIKKFEQYIKTIRLNTVEPDMLQFIGELLQSAPYELNVYYQRTQAGPVGAIQNPRYKTNRSLETDIQTYGEKGPVDQRWLDDSDKYMLGQNISSGSVTDAVLQRARSGEGVRYGIVFKTSEEYNKFKRLYEYYKKHGVIPGSGLTKDLDDIESAVDDESLE